jgi:hypothetical protein
VTKQEAKMLGFVGGLIVVLIVFVAVRIESTDAEFSIGWHTTAYPQDVTWSIVAIIILVLRLLMYVAFRTRTK